MPKRTCDDTFLYYCPRCGYRWERRQTHCGKLTHRLGRWGCLIVVVALALSLLCLIKIVGWL